jgi:hypothetical protein
MTRDRAAHDDASPLVPCSSRSTSRVNQRPHLSIHIRGQLARRRDIPSSLSRIFLASVTSLDVCRNRSVGRVSTV